MERWIAVSGLLIVVSLVGSVAQAATPSPKGAEVYIISPADGAVVSSPVHIQFGLKGMGVAPAGVDKANTGHHHLLVDGARQEMMKPIGKDATHMHFGGGQTETMLKLKPGKHRLQLLMGDKGHMPHNPPVMSKVITITVK